MIERYTRPEMGSIWTDENKFQIFLNIEILACEAQAELGIIPKEAVKAIKGKAKFDVKRIDEIEQTVKHDVIAFLTNVGEYVGDEARYIHVGMTSSDVLDTGLAVQMKQSGGLLLKDLFALAQVLARRANEFKHTVMVGRTHGVHAEPTTFGLKLALWYDETQRNIRRLNQSIDTISYGQISGAVGTYEHLEPFVERYVCEKLGIKPAPISNQILQRDLHAEFLTMIAIIGSSLEKFATEVRHLQRTEVLEAEEYFSKGQKGSSAMPHKRNPVTCERVAGLARVLRGNAQAAMENISLWHERDISHSSVERIIIPDSCILLDYMLATFTDIVDKLIVYPENMKKNLVLTGGLIFSQSVLLALTNKGMKREDAYAAVQKLAMDVWENKKDFKELLMRDPEIAKYLNTTEIESLFDLKKSIDKVDYIFKQVGI
ncbi:MAG: adenylosuccinate lyase [Bacteroidetes bacterium]|nr:adenylosuccinate lyase [Bacteroidota bacterium]MBU1422425.1 adenylosuccinate lyase [Bacteroidota bacterium]MBU2472261.1 adenylosuccinate lyase [Bacteroidota bacterium]